MDADIAEALRRADLVDIVTVGRRSGEERRIEVKPFWVGDVLYLSGIPGARSWYANLLANPQLVIYLQPTAGLRLEGRAEPVIDGSERQAVLESVMRQVTGLVDDKAPLYRGHSRYQRQLRDYVAGSPLLRVTLAG